MTIWQWLASLFAPPAPAPKPVPAPTPAPPRPQPIPEPLGLLLDAINGARADHYLPALMPNAALDLIAQSRAAKMHQRGILSHAGFEDEVADHYPRQQTGECIEYGPSAAHVIAAWMGHPPHREIVLGRFAYVGCGRSGDYWVCDFLSN
jgi:uncharacterized protein YkwD